MTQKTDYEVRRRMSLFNYYDANNKNYLDKSNLRQVIIDFTGKVCGEIPREESESILDEALKIYSNKGRISFEQFEQMIDFFEMEKGLIL